MVKKSNPDDMDVHGKKKRMDKILSILKKQYPILHTELNYKTSFQLLVSIILSAQCTDKRVNMVTPHLFAKYPNAQALAKARHKDIEKLIHSTGFYRAKTKAIIGCAKTIVEKHNGEVPRTMAELIKLPGVGRKTANVMLWNAHGINEGIAVDTHVKRISKLLGMTNQKEPGKIEQDLMKLVPKKEWGDLTHLFIFHGRKICIARRPRCNECPIEQYCPSSRLKPEKPEH